MPCGGPKLQTFCRAWEKPRGAVQEPRLRGVAVMASSVFSSTGRTARSRCVFHHAIQLRDRIKRPQDHGPERGGHGFQLAQVRGRITKHEVEIQRRDRRALHRGSGVADQDDVEPLLNERRDQSCAKRARVHPLRIGRPMALRKASAGTLKSSPRSPPSLGIVQRPPCRNSHMVTVGSSLSARVTRCFVAKTWRSQRSGTPSVADLASMPPSI